MKKIMMILVMMVVANMALALEWNTCCAYWSRSDPAPADQKFTLQDDGQGVYIKSWSSTVPKPTEAELTAVEATAIAWMLDKTKDEEADFSKWEARTKALAKLFRKEINKIRVAHGLDAYTVDEFKAMLKNEM